MIIAAHIQHSNNSPSFLAKHISQLATEHATTRFILFSETSILPHALPANCELVPIKPKLTNTILLHFWYNYRLPTLLKKHNATLFISENNVCSLRTPLPQLMLLKDIAVLSPANAKLVHKRYLKKYFPDFVNKAAACLASTPALAQEFNSIYPGQSGKMVNIFHGLDEHYTPITEEAQAAVIEAHTDGHSYFVCECNRQNQAQMLMLLKAFSLFKKRLKSGMQLLLVNKAGENPIPDFRLYKYRNEVKLLSPTTEKEEASWLAAAYAGIEITSQTSNSDWGLLCMQCGVPLIATDDERAIAQYADAAIYAASNEQALAEQLMLLYKDETLRNSLAGKGIAQTVPYTWQHSSSRLWQSILQCSKD